MNSTAEALKAKLLDELTEGLRERVAPDRAPEAERFLRSYYSTVLPDEVLSAPPESLLGAVLALWTLGQQRTAEAPKLHLYNPNFAEHGWQSRHTVLEAVNDDMPFLVDSLSAALNEADLTLHQVIHPVIYCRRDADGQLLEVCPRDTEDARAESFIHIELDLVADAAALQALADRLHSVLEDVRLAVQDWQAMRSQLHRLLEELETTPPPLAEEDCAEGTQFLRWLDDNNFTFLGYREAVIESDDQGDSLRALLDTSLGILRKPETLEHYSGPQLLEETRADFAQRRELLLVTKSSHRSTVHRPVHLDYIGVRRFAPDGRVIGEVRFLGLFTSTAYNSSARKIPLLRRKVARTVERAGFEGASHDGKALVHILETYPRDELFQISEDDLLRTSRGILRIQERQRLAMFVREDPFQRFVSCLVFVPRDRFNTELRLNIRGILESAFDGQVTAFYTQLSDLPLAQVHFVVKTTAGRIPRYDPRQIEEQLASAARTWQDRLQQVLIDKRPEAQARELARRYGDAFSVAYRDNFPPESALADIDTIEEVLSGRPLGLSLYRKLTDKAHEARFKIYHLGRALPLSEVLPKLESMGLRVISEVPYEVQPWLEDDEAPQLSGSGSTASVWIRDFDLHQAEGVGFDVGAVKESFEATLRQVWAGGIEDDGFNQLVLRAGLTSRQVVVLRAYCRYMRQIGITFSQRYIEATLSRNADLARLLIELFYLRFDPHPSSLKSGPKKGSLQEASLDGNDGSRDEAIRELRRKKRQALDLVQNVDEDRIVRLFWELIEATLRTNFFQTVHDDQGVERPKSYLSFKFDCSKISELPKPRPRFEIFVYSPSFEGIHLRGGSVARGGLRWSDRLEDFRTEILGLMKAQMVKNAVIVPVGSKGGFVVKHPPAEREAQLQAGQDCYRGFIRGLLDVTDNLRDGAVEPPPAVVRHDGDDPYLVVAADKGTATFSDLANSVAAEVDFWLGDAFASGGSAGYDHKKMGITARGAWECVKRHFRELGVDVQNQSVTAVGVGDMSGDVFGNGMLLSKHLRLIGAFNHLHIFVDPDPDPATSFAERQRLFELPRSSWLDYDTKLLSPGGAIFDRQAKTLKLTPQIRQLLGLELDEITPTELIRALLTAEIDLLWFGGIGTYVKASNEHHSDTGDRANDAVRVNGIELRCRVVGEGANLGLTQRGRIEYALHGGPRQDDGRGYGGRLNTDFIDNSGGVDCSDHEVNIKILLGGVVANGDLTIKHRDQLLEEMTDEVADLVLRDNYLQSQAISVEAARGLEALSHQRRMMRRLERSGKLDRALEFLPDEESLTRRQHEGGQGLSRPEISVLLSYSKLVLFEQLLDSDLPDDPLLLEDLVRYFPTPLQQRFRPQIEHHRLRREIIATHATNSMVNRVGPTFVTRMVESTGMPGSQIARAYLVARDAFRMRPLWSQIEALDNQVDTRLQLRMLLDTGEIVKQAVAWLLHQNRSIDITAAVTELAPGVEALRQHLDQILPANRREHLEARATELCEQGVPDELAHQIASLRFLISTFDIVRIAREGRSIPEVAEAYFQIGERFHLVWLREATAALEHHTPMQRDAISALMEDLYAHQRDLTHLALRSPDGDAWTATETWLDQNREEVEPVIEVLEEAHGAKTGPDLATLTVANHQLRRLASAYRLQR